MLRVRLYTRETVLRNSFPFKGVAIIIIIATLSLSCSKILKVSSIEGKGEITLAKNGHILIAGKYIFDTGAKVTVFTGRDTLNIPGKKTLYSQKVEDANGVYKREKYYYFDEVLIGNLHLQKAHLLKIPYESLSKNMKELINGGILGMNSINQANWIINFKEFIIECIPKDSLISIPAENKMKLSYKNKVHPKVTLTINGITFKNMLFDTGAFDELSLTKSQISQIEEIELYGSIGMNGLYSKQTSNVYICKELNLNNVLFRDVLITETTKFPLIGMGIIKQFNHLFIDTKNQVFYLYN